MDSKRRMILNGGDRILLGTMFVLAMVLLGVQTARGGEVVPAIGMTRAVEGDEEARGYGSLAFRGNLLPMLKSEIAVAYRNESRFDDRLRVRMWPITTSLYLSPIPAIYAGGGVGWYHVTRDYDQERIPFPIEDETRQEFGVHLGGGLQVPLGPSAGIDLGGRYVMMQDQESRLVPEEFDADFWTTTLGLALRF